MEKFQNGGRMKNHKGTQDKRLRKLTNTITRSIMAIYDGRTASLDYKAINEDDIIVDPSTSNPSIYEIIAGCFPLKFDPESIDLDIFEDGEIDNTLVVVLEIDKKAENFNVSASDKDITGVYDLGIHIAIETPQAFKNSHRNILRNEVANSVRHELEHITQGEVSDQPGKAFSRGDKYYRFTNAPDSVETSYAKYLLKPEEIPAHVRGYAQNAKSLKLFSESVEDLLLNYLNKKLIKEKEKFIVKSTWIDWARDNINRKNYKNS